jgi:hypothetical protein
MVILQTLVLILSNEVKVKVKVKVNVTEPSGALPPGKAEEQELGITVNHFS